MMSEVEGVWRSGNLLVIHKNAQLPNRCIKTNQPANGQRFRAELYWHHLLIYILLPVYLLLYIIVGGIFQKKAIVYVGLTQKILQKHKRDIFICRIVTILGIGTFFQGTTYKNLLMFFLGLALILGVLIWAFVKLKIVSVERIEGDYIWLRGVCQEYLDMLPPWSTAHKINL
ncbi:MAG TPA: hypothetical protein VK203_16865 [Nostocaceae cyanobacterium]|nr:hypothetical protein [Nostocaceae cyanobacterium]